MMLTRKLFQADDTTLGNTGRLLFIFFAWMFTSIVLNYYSQLLVPLIPPSNFYREFIICGGQLVVQFFVMSSMYKGKVIYYLTNMMVVSFAGALLLLPLIVADEMVTVSPAWAAGYFMVVVAAMFFEHIRRVKILNVGAVATVSWVAYRLMVLLIISKL